jgi:hypothetical protein
MNTSPAGPVKPWLDRLLEIAIILVVIGVLLNVAYDLIMPLVPFIIITTSIIGAIGIITTIVVRRRQGGW